MREREIKKKIYKGLSNKRKRVGKGWEVIISGRISGKKKIKKDLRVGGSGRSISGTGSTRNMTIFTKLGTIGLKIRVS
jgi:hypothetical protein